MIAITPDMGIYYEVHAETAKGINVFNSFGWHIRAAGLRLKAAKPRSKFKGAEARSRAASSVQGAGLFN